MRGEEEMRGDTFRGEERVKDGRDLVVVEVVEEGG